MTRRKKPSNKTIVIEAKKGNVTITLPDRGGVDPDYYDHERTLANFDGDTFMFPNDLDKIQPVQKDGNLCIRFPE